MLPNKFAPIYAVLAGMLASLIPAYGQPASPLTGDRPANASHARSATTDHTAPTPADPYPRSAAGWGPDAGHGLMISRWAEDWTELRAAGNAPPLKAAPLARNVSFTLSAEARLRYDMFDNGQLIRNNNYRQGNFRGVVGSELRFNPHLRFYGELGTGQVAGRRHTATAHFQNTASLQQLLLDVRGHVGPTLVGAMIGRQEFADGPRQLISVSDGPNLHRTWNGTRLYVHGRRLRLGAFDLRVTRLGRKAFDEKINRAERLQGINGSLVVSSGNGADLYLDPFWMRSENPIFRSGGRIGRDRRDTYGARLWGRRGALRFDWTLVHQTGESLGRDIDAWGLFAVQSLALSNRSWKPRLTAHVDVATGGSTQGAGTSKGFNPLYASSGYLGEGQLLSLSNLLLVAPGVSVAPTATTSLAIEYGFARRLRETDAAYAGGLRALAGTQHVSGHEIGGLLRVVWTWAATRHLTLSLNYEHLAVGDVLRRARLPSGAYGYTGATFRY